jgi:hypothetical protein
MNMHISTALFGIPQADPALAAISTCRSALTAYEQACKDSDQDALDAPPEVEAAGLVFYEAWLAVRSTKPTTLAGVKAYAAFAINLSKHMGADDYVEQAMATLADEGA